MNDEKKEEFEAKQLPPVVRKIAVGFFILSLVFLALWLFQSRVLSLGNSSIFDSIGFTRIASAGGWGNCRMLTEGVHENVFLKGFDEPTQCYTIPLGYRRFENTSKESVHLKIEIEFENSEGGPIAARASNGSIVGVEYEGTSFRYLGPAGEKTSLRIAKE